MFTILVLEGMHLAETRNKFSEFNLFYKYLTQKREIVINK